MSFIFLLMERESIQPQTWPRRNADVFALADWKTLIQRIDLTWVDFPVSLVLPGIALVPPAAAAAGARALI